MQNHFKNIERIRKATKAVEIATMTMAVQMYAAYDSRAKEFKTMEKSLVSLTVEGF